MKTLKYLITTVFILTSSTIVIPQNVRLFHSLAEEENIVLIPHIEGEWIYDLFGRDTLTIKKRGDNFYHLISSQHISLVFEARITKTANQFFLELLHLNDTQPIINNNYIPVYTIFRVDINKDTFRFAEFSYEWFYRKLKTDSINLNYIWKNNNLIITSPTSELRAFLQTYGGDNELFGDELSMNRATDKRTMNTPSMPKYNLLEFKNSQSDSTYLCLPKFELKDGWLGGDGNVSVKIGNNETLWFFSDSWVGSKTQSTRKNAGMINNSVAIMKCEPDGQSILNYYWKDMYTDRPKSIFESFTKRYHYWINDAFLYNDVLYVVLQKIKNGKYQIASPNEIFNFEQVGWTLAKVSNFRMCAPNEWDIQYISWSDIFDRQHWDGQVIKFDNYIYSFFQNENDESSLLRFPIEFVENPKNHIEYYSINNEWSKGVEVKNIAKLFKGDGGQTTRYYSDVNQWIMIIGPGYVNNKIRIRTSIEITGPWSEEKVIYTIPEQTPGSLLYRKDNFCYLAREHHQFYNSKTKEIIITYDINTSNFENFLNNLDIYTPKVISITLSSIGEFVEPTQ